jgi:hypothetical protein
MKQFVKSGAEYIGVVALWLVGAVTVYPKTWALQGLLWVAGIGTVGMILYGIAAIWERREGDQHYFNVAFLGIILTVASLSFSVWRMPGGSLFLLGCLVVSALVLIAFFVSKLRSARAAAHAH